jgi:hypothetical protein
MSLARNLARLFPNASGLLPNANIEAMAASKLSGQVLDANAPSGSVIQVVQGTTSTAVSNSGSTYVATNLAASITPSSSTSKILVFGQIFVSGSTNTSQPTITLYRNGSNLIGPGYGFGDIYTVSGGYTEGVIPFSFLDTPSTTSSTAYAIYGSGRGAGSSSFNDSARLSVITLLEIAA